MGTGHSHGVSSEAASTGTGSGSGTGTSPSSASGVSAPLPLPLPVHLPSAFPTSEAAAAATLDRIHSSIQQMQSHYDGIIKKWEKRARNLENELKVQRLKHKDNKEKDQPKEKLKHKQKEVDHMPEQGQTHTQPSAAPSSASLGVSAVSSSMFSSSLENDLVPISIEDSVRDVLWLRRYLQRTETNFLQDRGTLRERQQSQTLVKSIRHTIEQTVPNLNISFSSKMSPLSESHVSADRDEHSISAASRDICSRCWRPLDFAEMKSPNSAFSPHSYANDVHWARKPKVRDAMENFSKGHAFVDGKWQPTAEDGDVGSELDGIVFDDQKHTNASSPPVTATNSQTKSAANWRRGMSSSGGNNIANSNNNPGAAIVSQPQSQADRQSQPQPQAPPQQHRQHSHSHSRTKLRVSLEEEKVLLDSDSEELQSQLSEQDERDKAKPIISGSRHGRESKILHEFEHVDALTRRRWSESHSRNYPTTPSPSASSSSSSSSAAASSTSTFPTASDSLSKSAPAAAMSPLSQPFIPPSAAIIRSLAISAHDLFCHIHNTASDTPNASASASASSNVNLNSNTAARTDANRNGIENGVVVGVGNLLEASVSHWLAECSDTERRQLHRIAAAMPKFSLLRHALDIKYGTITLHSTLSSSLIRTMNAAASCSSAALPVPAAAAPSAAHTQCIEDGHDADFNGSDNEGGDESLEETVEYEEKEAAEAEAEEDKDDVKAGIHGDELLELDGFDDDDDTRLASNRVVRPDDLSELDDL